MSKQNSSEAIPGQSSTRVVPISLGLCAIIVLALWLYEPALALSVALAAGLPTVLVLAYCALRIVVASKPLRWRWPVRPGQWLDSGTNLLPGSALAELGGPLLERSQRQGKPLALLVFDFTDLADVQDLYGERAQRQLLRLIGRGLRRLAGSKGMALRLTASRFLVLLPGCTGALALELAATRVGPSCSFGLDSAQHQLVLVPRVTALCATAETDSVEKLLRTVQVQPVFAAACGR